MPARAPGDARSEIGSERTQAPGDASAPGLFLNRPSTTCLQRQLPIVSAETGLEPRRLLQWIVAYSGLSAAWFLGDGSTESADLQLTVARIALAELG